MSHDASRPLMMRGIGNLVWCVGIMNSSVTLAISSLYGEWGWGGDAKVVVFDPMWQLKEFWQDRNERKHIAQLSGPRVSYVLSHQIVKSFHFQDFR